MKQIGALLRGTWWLWILLVGLSLVLAELVDAVFLVMLPICLVTMVYFALIRFDEDGNRREH